jgi:2-C-methyl-D-erythritol 4-phosphate cytidylyltransferase
MKHRVVALMPAGGRGQRFGGGQAKQFLEVEGRPLLAWTASRLLAGGVEEIVIALPEGSRLPDDSILGGAVRAVVGGASRQESVARCLAAVRAAPEDLVLVHDGARAAVHPEDVRRVIAAVAEGPGAVLGRRSSDTLKRVAGGEIRDTVDRRELFRAETPQGFRYEVLSRAMALAVRDGFAGTDESSLVERLGSERVLAIEALHANPKLTEPADLAVIAALLREGVK